jgi:hypothetical protein
VDGVVDPNIRVIEVERGGQRLRCHRLYRLAREGLEPREETTRDGGFGELDSQCCNQVG